jgi:hypothetical protein
MQKEFALEQVIYTMVPWFLEGMLSSERLQHARASTRIMAEFLQQSCALLEDIEHDEPPA